MAKQETWIDEVEASQIIGLSVKMLTRYATNKTIPVRISRATRKAKPRLVKEDIITLFSLKQK